MSKYSFGFKLNKKIYLWLQNKLYIIHIIPIAIVLCLSVFFLYGQMGLSINEVSPMLSFLFAFSLFLGLWLRNVYLKRRYALRQSTKVYYSPDVINLGAMLLFANAVWCLLIFINAIALKTNIISLFSVKFSDGEAIDGLMTQGVAIVTLVVVIITAYYLVTMQGTYNQAKDFLKNLERSMLQVQDEIRDLDRQRLLIKKLRHEQTYRLHAMLLYDLAFGLKDQNEEGLGKSTAKLADLNLKFANIVSSIMTEDGGYKNNDFESIEKLKSNIEVLRDFMEENKDQTSFVEILIDSVREYFVYLNSLESLSFDEQKLVRDCKKMIDEIDYTLLKS
ncbi:MAG: hypothetical protein WAQ53_03140 [Thiofilum sp.]|uniref:hypothetical protein n=1 Tax=Thiofilum sp. TaxID=2212733 RepID=UPI0025DC9252|nr:hypothetical protein [Thiofilum sp.]MBK8454685.1 hypothetical protein [Thiofilum sp.]